MESTLRQSVNGFIGEGSWSPDLPISALLPGNCFHCPSVPPPPDGRGWRGLSGTGKLKLANGVNGATKEPFARAFSYLAANKSALGVARDVDKSDFHMECIDLLGNKVDGNIGVAFPVACYSIVSVLFSTPAVGGGCPAGAAARGSGGEGGGGRHLRFGGLGPSGGDAGGGP